VSMGKIRVTGGKALRTKDWKHILQTIVYKQKDEKRGRIMSRLKVPWRLRQSSVSSSRQWIAKVSRGGVIGDRGKLSK